MKRYFPQLDGLRAIAAAIVLVHHYWPALGRLDPTHGRIGVDIFFVLSGFLITRSLMRDEDRRPGQTGAILKRFHERRVRRIIPLYYLTLFLAWKVLPSEHAPYVWWHFAFLSNVYFVVQGRFVGAGGHLWALAIEEQFYLVWPLIVLAVPRRRISSAALVMIGLGLLFRMACLLFGWSSLTVDLMTPTAFESLGCGALLASWVPEDPAPQTNQAIRFAGVIGAVLWGIRSIALGTRFEALSTLFLTELSRSCLVLWIIAQMVHGLPGFLGKFLELAPMRMLGAWSYCIYLSHNYFLGFCSGTYRWGPLSVRHTQTLRALLLTLIWSALCYSFFEKPFIGRRAEPTQGFTNLPARGTIKTE